MQQTVRVQMDVAEWRALLALAARAKPKGEEEEALSKCVQANAQALGSATSVEIRDPF